MVAQRCSVGVASRVACDHRIAGLRAAGRVGRARCHLGPARPGSRKCAARRYHWGEPRYGSWLNDAGGDEISLVASALPGTVAPLSQETSSANGPVVPPAEDLGARRRLPIFDAVESRWFRDGRGAPGLSDRTVATGSRWSSPADAGSRAAAAADSPSSGGSTEAGLPKRLPNANRVPGAIPSAAPVAPNRSAAAARERLAGLQRGVDKGRAAARQAESPGEDEEAQTGMPD